VTDVGDRSWEDPPWLDGEAFSIAEKAALQLGSSSGVPSHDVAVILGAGLAAAVSTLGRD